MCDFLIKTLQKSLHFTQSKSKISLIVFMICTAPQSTKPLVLWPFSSHSPISLPWKPRLQASSTLGAYPDIQSLLDKYIFCQFFNFFTTQFQISRTVSDTETSPHKCFLWMNEKDVAIRYVMSGGCRRREQFCTLKKKNSWTVNFPMLSCSFVIFCTLCYSLSKSPCFR